MIKKIVDVYYNTAKIPVGTKIKFAEEKQRYTLRASNVAFAICTKPMNALKTVLYTIIDWNNDIRGAENLIFSLGAETDDECKQMLERLTQGETEVSSRNQIKSN
jgi:hypothetical protein